jgi:hypothetical protein
MAMQYMIVPVVLGVLFAAASLVLIVVSAVHAIG